MFRWFISLFETKKVKLLKQLRKGDKINIYPPFGYYTTINGELYDGQVISITIHNNDPISKKVWFFYKVKGSDISFVKSYNSEIFKDYILLNILTKDEPKPKSKQDLEKELEKAISEENYELAKILNQEIKKLKDASN